MHTEKDLKAAIVEIFKAKWKERAGHLIPDTDDLELGNDSVRLNAAVLYADLADSTNLVNGYKDWFAAEIFKSYLITACRIIRDNDGEITAFDGDRVMAVFIGDTPNSSATRAALKINYAVERIINPSLKEAYPNTSFRLKHAVGIDSSKLFVARTGIRGANDLVWVGRAANYAAKLASIREENYATFITEDVYSKLGATSKFGGEPKKDMWERVMWSDRNIPIYRSSWWWKI